MPDELTPGANPSATPAAPVAAPTQAAVPPQTAVPDTSGHVTGEDFKDPIYGKKIENLYKDHQAKSQKLSEIEKEHKKYADALKELETLTRTNPKVRAALEEAYGVDPSATGTPAGKTPDESLTPQSVREELLARMEANQAAVAAVSEARRVHGALFTDHVEEVNDVCKVMSDGDAAQKLAIAMEVVKLRHGSPSAAPAPVVQAPVGTAAVEGTRGTAASPADAGPMTIEKAMREAGFSSWSDVLRADGVVA